MGRPWHIFKVAPAFAVAGGFAGTLLRCLVWAGAIAARSVTLITRKREATSNFISLPPGLILGLGRHYRREPLSTLGRIGIGSGTEPQDRLNHFPYIICHFFICHW